MLVLLRSLAWLALVVCSAALASPTFAAEAAGPPSDPVRVFYDGSDCPGPEIEFQVWERKAAQWIPHPDHARIATPSCQVEDAGILLNELRWRCAPSDDDPSPGWRRVDVFDSNRMSRCAVDQVAPDARRTLITITSPGDGASVLAAEPWVTLVGGVAVDGLDGSDYDVALLVDRAAPDGAIAGQVAALRHFLRSLGPRLGAVRIALISHPNLPPRRGESNSYRLELDWSRDADAIVRAALRLRQGAPLATLPGALGAALDAFERGRPGARRLIVAGVDGRVVDDSTAKAGDALSAVLARAHEAGVEFHWFALGGVAAEAPRWLRDTIDERRGSFQRIAPHRYGTSYLGNLSLPVAEEVWVEAERVEGGRIDAELDERGRFRARIPVQPGPNPFVVHAKISDGALVSRPLELVFDDEWILEKILEGERERIRAARSKRLELRAEHDEAPAPPTP